MNGFYNSTSDDQVFTKQNGHKIQLCFKEGCWVVDHADEVVCSFEAGADLPDVHQRLPMDVTIDDEKQVCCRYLSLTSWISEFDPRAADSGCGCHERAKSSPPRIWTENQT